MARTTTPGIPAIHAAFFLSGAGALAFETVWFSQAGLVVGNSVWSAALVVGAFMAGLALGNALAIRLSRRWTNLVRGYALVEAIAAASGLLLVLGFPFLPALTAPLLAPLLGEPAALDAARLAIAFLLMAVPATALGTTLPLLAGPLEASSGSYGLALGRLYGLNTLGAVAGTLAAELLLIPQLGLRGSGVAAAACNLAAAAIAWRVAQGFPPALAAASAVRIAGGGRILAAAFLAGGALLALEVVWFRFLLLFLDGTTLVFAVMLAAVLAGIGLGGLAAARLAAQLASLARAAAAGAAALVVGSYAAFGALVKLLSPLQPGSVATAVLLCVFLMAPVALLSGFLFTALGARLRARMQDAGAATGALTLANTTGAMLGSLLAAFVLLALLGMERAFLLLALLYGLIVLVIPAHEGASWRGLRPALAAGVALTLFPFGKMTAEYHRGVEERFGGRIVAAREGLSQTTFYLRHDFLGEPLFHRLVTNSYSMASTAVGVQRYMKLFAWLPAALHPGIESALVLCFGVGSTASAVAALPEVKAIDVVDTSRDILEMSAVVFPDPATHPLRDPRVSVHVEDARFFLQLAARRYDLIAGEPPPPKMAGVASLYTREYFALVRSRLNPGGIATYWLPAYLLLESEALSIVRAFCDAFEDCSLWSGLNRDWILVGSHGGIAPVRRAHFARLWKVEAIGSELRRFGIDGPAQLAGQFMADAAALRKVTEGIAPLVDDHPRRIRSALYAEAGTPAYTFLMDAERGRERLAASRWAAEIATESREGFRRRGILDAAFYPELRRADYSFWSDVADLVRGTDLVELPRWLLGSGALAAQIAARRSADDPLAAQHLAIDALASRRRPEVMDQDRFAALPPWGQTVVVFHHCLAGERARARAMMQWMQERDPSFAAWAARECDAEAPLR